MDDVLLCDPGLTTNPQSHRTNQQGCHKTMANSVDYFNGTETHRNSVTDNAISTESNVVMIKTDDFTPE